MHTASATRPGTSCLVQLARAVAPNFGCGPDCSATCAASRPALVSCLAFRTSRGRRSPSKTRLGEHSFAKTASSAVTGLRGRQWRDLKRRMKKSRRIKRANWSALLALAGPGRGLSACWLSLAWPWVFLVFSGLLTKGPGSWAGKWGSADMTLRGECWWDPTCPWFRLPDGLDPSGGRLSGCLFRACWGRP